jgi:hypothetical protein
MFEWKDFIGNEIEWETVLKQNPDYDFRQSYFWGNYLKDIGWSLQRKELTHDDRKILIQVIYKKFWPFVAIYLAGISKNEIKFLPSLIKHLKSKFKNHFMYVKFDSHNIENQTSLSELKSANFKKTIYSFRSRMHSVVNLNKSYDEILKNTKQKWRYNLKKALEKQLLIEKINNFDPDEIWKLSNELARLKGIKNLYSLNELKSYQKNLKEIALIVRAKNLNNEILGYYICIIHGNKAFQIFNAVNKNGNNLMAGYTILMFVIKKLKEKKIEKLYLGELNKKKYPGNFQFKSSFNQNSINIIGEYEYTNFYLFKLFLSIYLYIKN